MSPVNAPEFDTLVEKVTRITDVITAAEALLTDLAARLATLAQTAADFTALKAGVIAEATALDNKASELADAVAANTPAAPDEPLPA